MLEQTEFTSENITETANYDHLDEEAKTKSVVFEGEDE